MKPYKEVMGFSSRELFGKQMVIEYFTGTLKFTDLYREEEVEKRYVEGVTSLNMKEFRSCTVHISDDTKGSNGRSCHAWIVPAQFSALLKISDPRYLEGNRSPRVVREVNVIKGSVRFVQTIVPQLSSNFKQQYIRSVRTSKSMSAERSSL